MRFSICAIYCTLSVATAVAFPQKRNPTRCATSEQSPLRSKSGSSKRVAGFFVCASLLLLSKSNPLRWASIWVFLFTANWWSGFIQRNPPSRVGEIRFACEIWLRHVKCLRAWVDFISLSAPAKYFTKTLLPSPNTQKTSAWRCHAEVSYFTLSRLPGDQMIMSTIFSMP